MELDEIKSIPVKRWEAPVAVVSSNNLDVLIKRKALATTESLKHNLKMECWLAIASLAFPAYVFSTYAGEYVSLFAFIPVFMIADLLLRTFKFLKSVQRFERSHHAVRQHLHLLIIILKKFTRLYFYSTVVLIPLLFASALIFVHLDNLEKDPLLYAYDYRTALLSYLVAFVIWSTGMYFFTKWYLQKLYGKHLQHLQKQLKALEEK